MKNEFVTYEQALALKELGFDEPVIAMYKEEFKKDLYPTKYWGKDNRNSMWIEGIISAPTYQQAFRWFRDVHELEGVPQKADSFSWYKYCIWKYTSNGKHRVNDAFGFEYKTYEEAEQACLDKLIEICKTK
jgi:hypothetical protein